MPLNKIRALCAQIAVEIDPKKTALLIEELTTVILVDHADVLYRLRQQSEVPPSKSTS